MLGEAVEQDATAHSVRARSVMGISQVTTVALTENGINSAAPQDERGVGNVGAADVAERDASRAGMPEMTSHRNFVDQSPLSRSRLARSAIRRRISSASARSRAESRAP